ncbi:retinol-binding protein pinta [Anopheles ziemanni]|uniref:retinol-binding protein pinta n=1 Tax=Anopheles coustani TaxID=139045 RepID=UPI002659DD21|nr:retinol-binding protein pinta [Anopheles coustani]XP_058115817.1 retinol-binding protein pinta [Anopheles coustani]XP_058115818.1 retinol-binding protein pinta [Anopheles coustani]XP_058173368.1 retinol-binding protein pinta [Anopheles ziemanni]
MKTANAGSELIHVGNGVEETDALRTESIATVKQWLLEERPELQIPTESKLILYFLRTTKYNIDKTKRKLSTFLKNREKLTEWFKDRNPRRPEIQELLEIGVFLPLHQKDALNRQVVIIRTSAHNPQKHKQDNVFKVDKMILDLLMYLDETVSIHGVVAIFDMQGVTLGHALQLSPSMIKKAVESWENYPCKPKVLEFVNVPVHVNIVLNVFRSFMSAKMKERVTISRKGSKMENLVTLPRELGGSGESYQQLAEYWRETVQANESFFVQMEQNVFHL